ncbi:hypothetical protein [Streptomyces sp. SID3343]|uniref:hypothetical protein n=1 Tax=Streptomyces sp. SID3343 TaxID=2690260 RepID=UPI001371975A|nr:hypothetical protein [Streptomyces sp. SID3343]MYV99109.1 hypothetical protein [Streptomyces sp. SID3343]
MQFPALTLPDDQGCPIARADVPAGHVTAIFMCRNDPGMCDEWSPTAGGRPTLLFPSGALQPMPAPEPDANDADDVAGTADRLQNQTHPALPSLPELS